MKKAETYDPSVSLREKILYVLSLIEKGNATEVADEIIELDGISTEEGVADITLDIEKELHKLHEDGVVTRLKEHRQKIRYSLRPESN